MESNDVITVWFDDDVSHDMVHISESKTLNPASADFVYTSAIFKMIERLSAIRLKQYGPDWATIAPIDFT
jgi:hypothetical protein